MPSPLTPLQRDLVEEFGSIYEHYGFQRLKGLLVGLLLVEPDPLSLDDMAQMLGRSKGPISTAVRDLSGTGLVRKVDGPNARRDYYAAHPDLFLNNFKHNMAIVRKNRRTAEQFLREMEGDDAHAEALRNLDQMRAFYTLMESFYEDFAERWEAEAARLNGRS
jgi:DNA-binding transcriptional regulator GbsR (MarR family)